MPLLGSESKLKTAIITEVKAENTKRGLKSPDTKALDSLATAISNAVIKHFTANAEVASGIAVATSGGAGATSAPGKLI